MPGKLGAQSRLYSGSELVRDALRRQLALTQLDDLRRRIMPLAEARGYLTDEDIFRDVS